MSIERARAARSGGAPLEEREPTESGVVRIAESEHHATGVAPVDKRSPAVADTAQASLRLGPGDGAPPLWGGVLLLLWAALVYASYVLAYLR